MSVSFILLAFPEPVGEALALALTRFYHMETQNFPTLPSTLPPSATLLVYGEAPQNVVDGACRHTGHVLFVRHETPPPQAMMALQTPLTISRLATFLAALPDTSAQLHALPRIHTFLLDVRRHCLLDPAQTHTIRLTERETDLLARLCEARPHPVSRDTLLADVWGYDPHTHTHTLESYIYRLRRKLGNADLLQTTPQGYLLSS